MAKQTWWERLIALFTDRIDEIGTVQLTALQALLEAVRVNLVRELASAGDQPLTVGLVDALISRMTRDVQTVERQLPGLADTALTGAAEAGAEAADALAAQADIARMPTQRVERTKLGILADYNAELIRRGVTDSVRADIANYIRQAYLTGRSPFDVMRDVASLDIDPLQFGSRMNRAEVIVRTELGKLSNQVEYERVQRYQAGDDQAWMKKWRSARDKRVRPTHVAADAAPAVAFNDDFLVGGHKARYPHDPQLPAKEVVNCRCVALYIPPGVSL